MEGLKMYQSKNIIDVSDYLREIKEIRKEIKKYSDY